PELQGDDGGPDADHEPSGRDREQEMECGRHPAQVRGGLDRVADQDSRERRVEYPAGTVGADHVEQARAATWPSFAGRYTTANIIGIVIGAVQRNPAPSFAPALA